jgi:hypothetical protein
VPGEKLPNAADEDTMDLAGKRGRFDRRLFDFEAEMAAVMAGGGVWTLIADAFEPRPMTLARFDLAESIRGRADEWRWRLRAKAARFGGNPTWVRAGLPSPEFLERETKREQIIAFLLSGATSVRAALRDRRQLAPTPVRRAARAPRRSATRSAAKATARGAPSDGDPAPGDPLLASDVDLSRPAAIGGAR